jgi:hypothetical protein
MRIANLTGFENLLGFFCDLHTKTNPTNSKSVGFYFISKSLNYLY